jgi:hypothetical protein
MTVGLQRCDLEALGCDNNCDAVVSCIPQEYKLQLSQDGFCGFFASVERRIIPITSAFAGIENAKAKSEYIPRERSLLVHLRGAGA